MKNNSSQKLEAPEALREIPNHTFQGPNKHQIPMSNDQIKRFEFGSFEFVWDLVLEDWCFIFHLDRGTKILSLTV